MTDEDDALAESTPSERLREVRQRVSEIAELLAELQGQIEALEEDVEQPPTVAVDEVTKRRALFIQGFTEAGGELTREQTYEVATKAGYEDMRGIAGWFNGQGATLRWNPSTQKNELTGSGYEYWRELRGVLDSE